MGRLQARHDQEELERFDALPFEERVRIYGELGFDKFKLFYGEERISRVDTITTRVSATGESTQPERGKGRLSDFAIPEGGTPTQQPKAGIYPDGNPKTQFGIAKPGNWYVPTIPYLEYGLAHLQGALKYGPFNWRDDPVSISTYIEAAFRHVELYKAGQERASDTGIHHLAHAMTCLSIIIDAAAHGSLIDDRFNYRNETDNTDNDSQKPGSLLEAYIEDTQTRVKAIRTQWTGFAEAQRKKKEAE